MRFAVDQSVIAPAATAAARVAPSKPTLPALEGVSLRYRDCMVTVKAMNFEASLELFVPAQRLEEEEEGEVLVSSRLLSALLNKMSGVLLFETGINGSSLEIRLKDGGRADARLPLYSPEGLPTMGCADGADCLIFKAGELRGILRRLLLPSFDGLFFDLKEDVVTVLGTDRYRISLLDVFYPACGAGNFYVSREQVEKLLPLLSGDEDVEICWSDGLITFRSQSRFVYTVRRAVAKMIPYAKVLPQTEVVSLELERDTTSEAFERAALFYSGAENTLSPVCLKHNGADVLDISIENAQIGSFSESVPCRGGGEFEAMYNPTYLYDAVRAADSEKIVLKLNEKKFLKVTAGGYTALVLPVSIQSTTQSS